MAITWFVTPERVRVPLPDGHWIDLKKRLTIGEQRQAMASVVKDWRADTAPTKDVEMVGIAEVASYLVDWSITNEKGERVPISDDAMKLAAIKSLSVEAFDIIDKAVTAHVEAQAQARVQEKNDQGIAGS